MKSEKITSKSATNQKQHCELQADEERFLPWMEASIPNYEHLHRYGFAKEFVKDKKVLDLACGEGYGSAMLAEKAEEVVGVDINEAAIKHASTKYVKDNLKFIRSSITEVTIEGGKLFDVITCFEALEHVEEQNKAIAEVKRLLKDDGIFIVSTPNKYVYSDLSNRKNPWHKKELYLEEFKSLLKSSFSNVLMYGQKVFPTSNIFPISEGSNNTQELAIEKIESEFSFVSLDKKEATFFIAVASEDPMTSIIGSSYLVDTSETLFRQITELEAIHSSHGWKFLLCYYNFRDKIFPPNTKRKAYAKSLLEILRRMNKSIKKRFLGCIEQVYNFAHLAYKNLPLSVRRNVAVNKLACLVRAMVLSQLADEPIYPLDKTLAFFCEKRRDMLNIEYPENTLANINNVFGILLNSVKKAKETILIFDHTLGGGANIYRENYIKNRNREYAFLTLQYRIGLDYKLTFCFRNYNFVFKFDELETLKQLFDYVKIDEVIINNLVSFPTPLKVLADLSDFKRNKAFRITHLVHDYFCLCPNFSLFGKSEKYCETPSAFEECLNCLSSEYLNPVLFPKDFQSIRQWRNKWLFFLQICSKIICFSEFSKQTLLKTLRDLDAGKIEVIPHKIYPLPNVYSKSSGTEEVSIGVLGNIYSEEKGARILYEMANCIEKNGYSNLRIVVIGEIMQLKYRHNLIKRTGFFEHRDLPSLMLNNKIDIVLIPSIVPETFSYTAAEAISMGFPVAAFDLGAPAEQIKRYEKGLLLKDFDAESIIKTLVNYVGKNN